MSAALAESAASPLPPREPSRGLAVEKCPLDHLPAADWDRLLVPGRRLLCHAFLEAASTVELEGFSLGALLVRRSGELVSAAPAYPYRLDLTLFAGSLAFRVASALRLLLPGLLKLRVFEVGWPSTLIEPLLGAKDPAVLRAIAEAALARAAADRVPLVVLRDFAAEDEVAEAALAPLGFQAVPLPMDFLLDVSRFPDFESYLAAMRSDYRKRARKRLTRGRPVRFERVTDFAALAPDMVALSRAVYERARELRRENLPEAFFTRLARVPGASALLLRGEDGRASRFAVLHADGEVLRPLFYGGPPVADHDLAYLKMLYEFVRIAIEEGFRTLDLGVTTGEPKLDLGASPAAQCAWVRHRSPIVQRALVGLMRGPLAPRVLEARQVFREPCAA